MRAAVVVAGDLGRSPRMARRAAAVARGGHPGLAVLRADMRQLPLRDRSVDGVLALEVLEHQPDPHRAAREAVRVARRFVIATVPAREDDNPQHVSLIGGRLLQRLLHEAGAARVKLDGVLNHTIALAMV